MLSIYTSQCTDTLHGRGVAQRPFQRIMREIGNAHVIHILQHATDCHLELARKWEWLR